MKNLKLSGLKSIPATVLLCSLASLSVADIVVIVNPALGISSLSNKDLKRIYLGKVSSIADGTEMQLSDQKFDAPIREQFYQKCCSSSAQKARSRWAGILFSGNGQPPAVVGGDSDIVAWVAAHQDGMGYVNSAAVTSSVKVLTTLK